MLVKSNENADEWGKYFYLGELRKYVFGWDASQLAMTVSQRKDNKKQLGRLKSKQIMIGIDFLSLRHLGLTKEELEMYSITIEDIFFKKPIHPIQPMLLITDDASKYSIKINSWPKIPIHNPNEILDEILSLTNFQRGIMATGYTSFTSADDGSSRLAAGFIEMENGDFIGNILWEWYNK